MSARLPGKPPKPPRYPRYHPSTHVPSWLLTNPKFSSYLQKQVLATSQKTPFSLRVQHYTLTQARPARLPPQRDAISPGRTNGLPLAEHHRLSAGKEKRTARAMREQPAAPRGCHPGVADPIPSRTDHLGSLSPAAKGLRWEAARRQGCQEQRGLLRRSCENPHLSPD